MTIEDGEPLAIDGAPDIPVYRRLVAVANGSDVSITVGVDRTTVLDGVQLRSYKIPSGQDHGASPPFGNRAADALRKQRVFPETNAWIEYVGHMRGQRIASIVLSPVRWDRASGRIVVATDMDIRIAVDQPRGNVLNDVGPMDAALMGSVLNWSHRGAGGGIAGGPAGGRMMSAGGQVCWCTGSTWEEAATSAASCGADYLMIVTDSLASSSLIDSLAQRRASYNGFNVAIARVSQMDALPDTLETPVAIRSMIDSVYASQTAAHMSDGRLGYVLLVGDAFDIERNILVPSYYGYQKGDSVMAASDAYYSFLGDPATDRLPDVLIGRLPVDDDPLDWELTNVVTKILAYESLPASAWVDSVLMVSGVNPGGFSFGGQGLSGFQSFFDSVLAYYPPPGRSVTQLHRLTLPSNEGNHETFSEMVAARIEAGKWLTAFFDHGFLYYWDGAFYPRNYEFLENEEEPTIVLSLGSQTCQFDNTQETGQAWYGACCTWPPPPEPPFSIGCESPGYEYIDPCDAMGERLLVQPGGAIAVIGYSRTTGTWNAQRDLVSLFRSLSQQNPNTLGEFLLGARLFRLSDLVTVRNLMLLGDPALNIRTRAPAPADTFDVAVGTSDIRSPWGSYVRSSSTPIEVTVRNAWKTDVYDLEVKLWRGEPGGGGSSLLGTELIDTLRAWGPETITFSASGLDGNVRLYVVLDPDELIAERAEDNNIASRDFLALSYEGAYPTHLPFNGAAGSVTIADITSAPGKEVLVSGFTSTDQLLQCYAVGDTQAVWTYGTGSEVAFIKNQPVTGHLYKSASSYVAVEHGSSVRILSGQSGSVIKTRPFGDMRFLRNRWEAKWVLSDLGPDDPAMELVTLRYVKAGTVDSLQVRAFTPDAALLFTRAVDVGTGNAQPATMAVGDLDRNGSKEIVILQTRANSSIESPAAGKELTVLSYGAGGLTRRWQADLADGGTITNPAIVLIDRNGDGNLSILCNGVYPTAIPTSILRLYEADSTLVWTKSDFVQGSPIYFSAGDVNGNGTAEVVVLEHQKVRLLSSADASVIGSPRTMAGDPVAPPLLVDLDADGTLEVVVVFEQEDPNEHFYPPGDAPTWTHISILDVNLDLVQPVWTFRTRQSGSSSCLPAIDDIDGDGKFEMVYVSADQYLHVFELGSAAGEAAWSQRFANALNTGLNEQPIIGDGYSNPVSLYQKTRMLGHVTLDSLAAPSFYVGHGTEVRVDASVSDPFQLRAFGSVRMKGSADAPVVIHSDPPASGAATWGGLYVDDRFARATDPDTLAYVEFSGASVGIEVHSPLHVTASAVSNVFDAGIVTDDTLSVKGSDIVASSEVGIELLAGGHGWISDSHVDGAATGVIAVQGASVTIRNSTISNVGTAGVVAGDTLWFDRSAVSASSGLGIKLASGSVGRIRRSVVSNTDSTAILCDSCAYQTTVDSTSVRSAGGDGLRIIGSAAWQGTSGIAIDSCMVEDNAGAGIRFEGAHGTVGRCRVEGNAVGVIAADASNTSIIENTGISGGAVGVEHDSAVRITGSRINNVSSAAVVSSDTLWFESSEVDASAGQGIYLGSGALGRISDSSIAGTDFSAIVCDTCATGTIIRRTTIDSAGLHGIHVVMASDVVIDSCVVVNSESAGVRFEWADGIVSKSRLDGNGGGVVCFESSSPVIRECSMDGNTGGVVAVYDSYPVVGYGTSGGLNCITNSAGYHVTNLNSPGTIFARHDYWGAVCCKANKFFGSVSCDSCETSSACDAAAAPGSFVLVGGDAEARADSMTVQDDGGPALPKTLDLVSAAPNPFNPSVRIRYAVPVGGAHVQLTVYNVRGHRVATLEDGSIPAGYHEAIWHGLTSRGSPAASGVYFVQMSSGAFRKTMRVVLLK